MTVIEMPNRGNRMRMTPPKILEERSDGTTAAEIYSRGFFAGLEQGRNAESQQSMAAVRSLAEGILALCDEVEAGPPR